MKTDDSDILEARANIPHDRAILSYERVRQDRRIYYRLQPNGGSLTDAKHARETIAYWRERGWLK